jgi:hypothetical protein
MKRMSVVALLLMTAAGSFSQEKSFVIQQGTIMDYVVHLPAHDAPISAVLSVANNQEVKLDWIMDTETGTFRMEKASLDSARYGYWNQPIGGQDVTIDNSRTILQLSKACWNDIQLNRPVVFGSAKYIIKKRSTPYKAGDRLLDCVYLESENGDCFLWVANNEKLPMILRIEGNPDGVNVELVGVR